MMNDKDQPHPVFTPQALKGFEIFLLEASTELGKPTDVGWRCLLNKIYENINGPSLFKKKSSKLYSQEENEQKSDFSMKCTCKKTKCLKLYCECFNKGQYCNDCKCQDCHNSSRFDSIRSAIIDQIIIKNPNAFDPLQKTKMVVCICKKTGCLKKYCECYNLGQKCCSECKCANCLNID